MSEDEAQLSLSGFSSLFSISTTTPHPNHHHLDLPPPSLSLSIGTGGEEHEEDQVVSSGQGTTARVRMMKNRESALRSRARKRAYVQELEKEVRRLADDNLRLKRQFKQLKTEMAALVQQQPANGRQISSPNRRNSSM
ncbi:protein FD-like isoform X2 [Lolium rigidum]|uniref:protein FD-like isoform X2 n=1 Tax=Lolium rigidum TaxID=89674 RepID=UPI001F5C15C2|nr:protein FD-like isoform X2 [Lolium rigidum]